MRSVTSQTPERDLWAGFDQLLSQRFQSGIYVGVVIGFVLAWLLRVL